MSSNPRPATIDDPAAEVLASLLSEIKGESTPGTRTRLLGSDEDERLAAMHRLLADLLDQISDFEYNRKIGSFLQGCERAAAEILEPEDAGTTPIVAYLSFLRLNIKLLERRFESPDREQQDQADEYCKRLFEQTPVWKAVKALYRPGGRLSSSYSPSPIEREKWEELDFESCRYYRAGTTSFILRINPREAVDESGLKPDLVIKCVLFPWSRLAAVARAPDDYAGMYGGARTPSVVVHPQASTDQWVVMPFQPGETLAEHLRAFEAKHPSPGERVDKTRQIGIALIDALHQLACGEPVDPGHRERQHLDLSPGNIIVSVGRTVQMHFIDLGVNHLYSRQIGIAEHDDAVYIAPEIKNHGESAVADVYSVGVILIQILVGHPPRDGRVPDQVYEISPLLGRTLDDLIDENPRNRLLLLPAKPFRFDALGAELEYSFDLAAVESEASRNGWERMRARLLPTSREFSTQWKQRKVAKAEKRELDAYLLTFSFVMTLCWWWIFAKTALFKIDDVVTGEWDGLPKGDELAATIIAFSQALTGAKFYSMILARLNARQIPGMLARVTEIAIRLMSIVTLPTVLLSVYWKNSLWAWGCAFGAVAVSATNLLLLILSARVFDAGAAAKLSTVPPEGRRIARGFEQWWWSMLMYAVVIIVIATGLQTGWMHDRYAYVFGLVLISVGIQYVSKFVGAGYGVRAGLARALSVGERTAIIQARDGIKIQNWPPRLRPASADDPPAEKARPAPKPRASTEGAG
ncbi:protein kinase domain-containing protein [Winogradskya humida]|uniref:protein kinase domain-containing protein n=1 Tax=Winogradskya humida TaxID=113566 RepID=UPI0031CE4D76